MAGVNWDQYPDAGTSGSDQWDQYPDAEDKGPQSPSSWSDYGKAAASAAWKGIEKGLSTVDSYTGAPVRSAIYAAETSPTEMGRPVAAAKAFARQFGNDPSQAPTGTDIVNAGGYLPRDSVAAKVAGFGVDVLSNPTTYLPLGELASGAAKGVGSALGIGDSAPELAAIVKPGAAAKATGTAAETLTGLDKSLASNYAANTDRINSLIGKYAGPEGYAEANHVSDVQAGWRKAIQDTRKAANDQIGSALDGVEGQTKTSAKPLFDKIDSAISKADPATQKQDIATLNDMRSTLGEMVDADSNIPLKRLQAYKRYASNIGEGAYDARGNQIFPGGDFAASQAKGIASSARNALIADGPQSVAQAEAKLSSLHRVEDTMNSSLLKENSNGAIQAIGRAAANPGGTEARSLAQLSDLTGHDFASDAKDFATARQFAKAGFTPMDATGKSVARQIVARGIGAGVGGMVAGVPGAYVGEKIAGAAISPAAFKAGINVANAATKAAAYPVKAMAAIPQAMVSAAASPAGRTALDIGTKALLAQPSLAASAGPNRTPAAPARGPDAWASRGLQSLGIQDPQLSQRLLSDPKAKQLLIQASDLKPGSKAMQKIMSQIQKGWAQ